MQKNIRRIIPEILILFLILSGLSAFGGPGEKESFREFSIRLRPAGLEFSGVQMTSDRPSVHRVLAIGGRIVPGVPPRERRTELSEDHLVVLGLNAQGREIARVTLIDPRLIRAEWADDEGRLTKRILYRPSIDFTVFFPASGDITTVRVLKPEWTGAEFLFHALGETPVNFSERDGAGGRS
jgi:hypothetical protein